MLAMGKEHTEQVSVTMVIVSAEVRHFAANFICYRLMGEGEV